MYHEGTINGNPLDCKLYLLDEEWHLVIWHCVVIVL